MTIEAPVSYYSTFLFNPDMIHDRLHDELAWERRPDAPRSEYWTNTLNRPYTYGKGAGQRTYQPQPDHPLIEMIRLKVELQCGRDFEGCFLNSYGHKRDWLGWHMDDDPGIDHTKPIAVVTVGQGRNIQFRELLEPGTATAKPVYGPVHTQMLESGSLLLMHAGMQSTHQHRIPKADFEAKPRISLTFRGLL